MLEITFPEESAKQLRITIRGSLSVESLGSRWAQVMDKADKLDPQEITVDAQDVSYCDGAGIGLLIELRRRQSIRDKSFDIRGLKDQYTRLIDMVGDLEKPIPKESAGLCCEFLADLGKFIHIFWQDVLAQLAFLGEFSVKSMRVLLKPLSIRWHDVFFIAERAGANAVGITCLLGFLIGLILAFQSVIPMMRFGAEIFVANLVSITLFRELGPLITGFILASRSGSAFAAEIGTMKINEELSAMNTMGIDPMIFLVIPRVLASILVVPLLTVFNIFMGLLGAWLVMLSLDFTTVTFIDQIRDAVSNTDVIGGFVKTFVFGALISAIGCLRGLQTSTGATAVGDAATRAVVSSIVAIVVADGIFAVIFYYFKF